ncbi:hypothetical protein DFR49_3389 [Hephaestia caeni]|uniref:Uncharacterized protein n=1 Tax=Hephaestia caeni TaxID=645617 RepID=A0A397NUX1_9SPHN|nr:hypothetical protein [Hephaestia caeni]RIA37504.1 hypothetical protein DFR49_3389 [Hephaestia caeni]
MATLPNQTIDPADDHSMRTAWVDDDGTFHAAPDFDATPLTSPAILASLDTAATEAAFDPALRDTIRADSLPAYTNDAAIPTRAHPMMRPAPDDWLTDITRWTLANGDRVNRWIEIAVVALAIAMIVMMASRAIPALLAGAL